MRIRILVISFLIINSVCSFSQVRIRIFADLKPEQIFFGVEEGRYSINAFRGGSYNISKGELFLITRYEGRLIVKMRNSPAFRADSLIVSGTTGNDRFSVLSTTAVPVRQHYAGNLECRSDLGTILLINCCDNEMYIAGVVKAEGGNGRSSEFMKTQAVIARTYMYRYMEKHSADGYNLCDNTHCQAFSGVSADSSLNRAVRETSGIVILGNDSVPVISAFHSNCGGETASAEDVWLSSVPYLKGVKDPYCSGSRNATWQMSLAGTEWIATMRQHGYNGQLSELPGFRFIQDSRAAVYRTGAFTIPLKSLREELGLRSTFFSVVPRGDSIVLQGKGYGHGVGLCQEGAMAMASKGFNFRQIIDFYYSGVITADIKNAAPVPVLKK